MSDGEKHIFVTKKGEEFSFDTEDEMMKFATKISIQHMVENGLGELVLENGEEAFKINEKGLQYIKDHDEDTVH